MRASLNKPDMGQGQAEGKTEKKGENKVVVRVDMDCEACKQKVIKVLKNFPGVEDIDLDMDQQKVTIKGNVDVWKVYEALRKKCGKRTMLVYPQLSKEEERRAKEDSIINSVNKIVDSITDLLTPKPPNTIVELRVRMHCGACAKKIKKVLLRVDGVMEVDGDMASDKVVVKGRDLNADTLCNTVRQSGKPCDFISIKNAEKAQEKKKGEKKEEKKADNKEEKEEKAEEKKDEKQRKKKGGKNGENAEENKGENKGKKKGENKEGNKGENEAEKKEDTQEERKEEDKPEKEKGGAKNEKKEGKANDKEEAKQPTNEGEQEVDLELKKFTYTPYQSASSESVYAPQIFSDENPNACSLM